MIASRWAPIFSISSRSGPKILMPIGVRTPVVSMSIRARIGMVQALVTPGIRTFASISSINSSHEIRSGQMRLKTRFLSHSGDQFEYHCSLCRHSDWGFRRTVVSIMEKGAGSVEVSARPAFPKTLSTSGKLLISWS